MNVERDVEAPRAADVRLQAVEVVLGLVAAIGEPAEQMRERGLRIAGARVVLASNTIVVGIES